MQLLKFIACGSVDDGKSTLIGRILYDSKLLYTDQEQALELASKVGSRSGQIDYSLILDGLMAEREQGITIDVAYRYFTTDNRSFIVADTPGHEEYTRNMAVGASFADLAVILVDAQLGVLTQTRRHARICELMGIRYFVFAINKMDLVDYSKERFEEIQAQIEKLAADLHLQNVIAIPVSATEGDNVTKEPGHLSWYEGPVLLNYLEQVNIEDLNEEKGFYMPVQRVCRPNRTFRGFQGQIEAGKIKKGDEVSVLPGYEKAHIKNIFHLDQEAETAEKGDAVTIQLDREIDVSRGSVLTAEADIQTTDTVETVLLWMDDVQLQVKKNFFVKLGTRMLPGTITELCYAIDVNTGEKRKAETLEKNGIAVCRLRFADKIAADLFTNHRTLGEMILIDRVTNQTAACGVVRAVGVETEASAGPRAGYHATFGAEERGSWKGQAPVIVEFRLGINDVNREYVARVERDLAGRGRHTYLYEPGEADPAQEVLRHLWAAGIVILLAVPAGRDTGSLEWLPGYYGDWMKEKMTAAEAAEFVYRISMQN